MKNSIVFTRLLLLIILLSVTVYLAAQEIEFFIIPESIERVTESTDLIVNDHINNDNSSRGNSSIDESFEMSDDGIDERQSAFSMGNVGMSVEMQISAKNIYLRLPLSYSWNNLSLNLSIPYCFKKDMNYSVGTKTARGFGDVVMRGSYRCNHRRLSNEFGLSLKLPTGDENKVVDGHLVPLGTGTTDIIFSNNTSYLFSKFLVQSNISYRINNSYIRVGEIEHQDSKGKETITYDINNGNTFVFNTSLSYQLFRRIYLIGGISAITNGEGSLDRKHSFEGSGNTIEERNLSANQDFTYLDLHPAICYNIFNTDLVLSVKIPLITERNQSNSEDERKPELMFRLSRKLF